MGVAEVNLIFFLIPVFLYFFEHSVFVLFLYFFEHSQVNEVVKSLG